MTVFMEKMIGYLAATDLSLLAQTLLGVDDSMCMTAIWFKLWLKFGSNCLPDVCLVQGAAA